jgi:hypothetical protein
MFARSLAAALLAASALGLAACGDDEAPAASQSADRKARDAELKFAECMREHGIDFPDPQDGPGLVKIGKDESPEELREAEKACEKFRKAIKPPELTEAQQQEFKKRALQHARCMREHGIDFPDPTFSEDGGANIRLGPGRIDPEDDDFKAAEKECADKLGDGPIAERRP